MWIELFLMGILSHLFSHGKTRKNSHLFHTYFHMTYNIKNHTPFFTYIFHMAYTIKISHSIFYMDFLHNRKTLFFLHYFFTCSFESLLISQTKKEVHMYVKLQFCVWNLFHAQNFTCLIYFTCISHAFHIYFTRLLLVV